MPLRQLSWIEPIYIIPADDFPSEVMIPCLRVASAYSAMIGFFSSASLQVLAPGLADYLSNDVEPMRMLISPYLSAEDQEALRSGATEPVEMLTRKLEEVLGEASISETALVKHTLRCLAYMIATELLEIRIAFVPDGLLHTKAFIFDDANANTLVAHGSGNMTYPGLRSNVEQVSVSKSWTEEGAKVVGRLSEEFEALWQGSRAYARVYSLPESVRAEILTNRSLLPPTAEDFATAMAADAALDGRPTGHEPTPVHAERPEFSIPAHVVYDEGDFEHQGRAVRAWEDADRHGILEMATGSGKTYTSLVAASRLKDVVGALLIVVSAPTRPLVAQWREVVSEFSLRPVPNNPESPRKKRLSEIERALDHLGRGITDVECVVLTQDSFVDPEFAELLATAQVPSLLIADEVHNLGVRSFLDRPPESFDYRLGLSATPVRQYDEEGTEELMAFFNGVVFQFPLSEAIGVCLVPYEYHVHPVALTDTEQEQWSELTRKIGRVAWQLKSDADSYVQNLLIQRRRVLETAELKIDALESILEERGAANARHTLIYATDKDPKQLEDVHAALERQGISFHQLTQDETAQPRLQGRILDEFAQGTIAVLTSKRVLDEGVDIPEVSTAYLLASTTVERQWTQRRGRLLRRCPTLGKEKAVIHDFVTEPSMDAADLDARKVIRPELDRMREFSQLALNGTAAGGPLTTIDRLVTKYF